MTQRNYRIVSFLITTALMFACAVPAIAPASAPVPTLDPNSLNLVIAQTANAAATQTAQMLPPTLTPTVTLVPTSTITETPTATFVFILSTPTVPSATPTLDTSSSAPKYACRVESQKPADNTGITKGTDFDMTWHVINIGTETWSSDSTDYRYVGGDKLHKASIYDLNNSVAPGGKTDILVAMKAPSDPGTYTTTWNINVGKNRFCKMNLTILVN